MPAPWARTESVETLETWARMDPREDVVVPVPQEPQENQVYPDQSGSLDPRDLSDSRESAGWPDQWVMPESLADQERRDTKARREHVETKETSENWENRVRSAQSEALELWAAVELTDPSEPLEPPVQWASREPWECEDDRV